MRPLKLFQDDKACFSKIGTRSLQDFSVTFKDSQKLQLMQQTLLRVQSVLDSTTVVFERCQSLCSQLDQFEMSPGNQNVLANLAIYLSQTKLYRGNILRMIEYSRGTMSLVSPLSRFTSCLNSRFDQRAHSKASFSRSSNSATKR